jgi:subtilisin family serine protease
LGGGHTRGIACLAILAVACAVPAWGATTSKLNALARIAMSQAGSGASQAQINKRLGGGVVNDEGQLDLFVVGHLTEGDLAAMGAVVRTAIAGRPGVFTVYAGPAVVDAIASHPMVQAIHGAAPAELELDLSVPTTNAPAFRGPAPGFGGLDGTGVLIGDVDTGVDYDHDDFLDAGGLTRFAAVWDQTDALGPTPFDNGAGPYTYGSDWTPADLDADLAREIDAIGHGSHVLGIAGGDGSATGGAVAPFTYVGMAPNAALVMVKTTLQTTDILDGVAYIMGRGAALGRPTVVNLSLGTHYGPHDGTSPFEAGLSSLVQPGRIIVKSAGNERGQARHAQVNAAGAGTDVTALMNGSAPGRMVAFDGYYEATENLSLQITTPDGTVIGPIALGGSNGPHPGTATANGDVYAENGMALTATNDREVYIEVNIGAAQNMNGLWTFRFIPVALGAANGEVDLWRFFNSAFTSANFQVGNQNDELISEPGNAAELITVAAWTTRRNWFDCAGNGLNFIGSVNPPALSPFSSPGPTRDDRPKPDLAAPGSAIGSATTFDVAQACPGPSIPSTLLDDGMQHSVNQGTSMAAPHVAGAVALLLQRYGDMSPAFVRHQLRVHAQSDGITGPVWNPDWGSGRLHLGTPSDPLVTVLAPNGGETVIVGGVENLIWTATDPDNVVSVDLYLSRDGGHSYETIALGVPNTGSHPWTVTAPVTTRAMLSVVAHDQLANLEGDLSDATFTIDSQTASLLSLFRAEVDGGAVAVSWAFGDPAAIRSVVLERAPAPAGPYAVVEAERRIDGAVTTAIDRGVVAGGVYFYRLVATPRTGQPMTFGPLRADAGSSILAFALGRAFPNPSTGVTTIEFAVPRRSDLRISVLDVQGREVELLAEGTYAPGRYQATWSGEARGARAPAGLYFLRYAPKGAASFVQRVVLTR